jgi:hypothetical protein
LIEKFSPRAFAVAVEFTLSFVFLRRCGRRYFFFTFFCCRLIAVAFF